MADQGRQQVLESEIDSLQPDQMEPWIRNVANLIDRPTRHIKFTYNTEIGNSITVTGQLRDRNKYSKSERWAVMVWISETEDGAPSAAQTVTVATGIEIKEITADSIYIVQTTAAGVIALDILIVGAASRFVNAHLLGRLDQSDEITWA